MSNFDFENNTHQSPVLENQNGVDSNATNVSNQQASPPFQLKTTLPVQSKAAPFPFEKEKDGSDNDIKITRSYGDGLPNNPPGISSPAESAAPPFQLKSSTIQRAPDSPAPAPEEKDKVTGKLFLQQKIGEKEYSYAKASGSYKAEAEYSLNIPKSKGVGSHDVSIGKKDGANTLAVKKELEQKAKEKFLGVEWSLKEGIEFNNTGGEIGVEGGFEGDRLFGSLKFVPFSIGEGKDKKTEFKFMNLAVEMGLKAVEAKDVPVSFIAGATLDYKFKGSFIVEIEPNMKKIALELAKRAGLQLAEGLVLDLGAVGFAAAAIALPALAAGMMIAGAIQTEKNIKASHAASRAGTVFRQEARTYAQDYARTMTGGTAKGKGGAAAENMLTLWCTANEGNREAAVAAATKSNGNYSTIYQNILKSAKDKYFPTAVAEFNKANDKEFGILESFGDDWGMKGTFQKDLRRILYADDFN